MDWVIAIPTLSRVKKLGKSSLALLERHHIDKSRIFIFVVAEEEAEYKAAFPEYKIVVGVLGLTNQLNFIQNFFSLGQPIVRLEDDIDDVYRLNGDKTAPVTNLAKFIDDAFELCKTKNVKLWGPTQYNHRNTMFLKPKISIGCYMCRGGFLGFINRQFQITQSVANDWEQCLEYSKLDGGVIRFDDVALKSAYYQPGGFGMAKKERLELCTTQIAVLVERYPTLCKINTKEPWKIRLFRTKKNNI
jgi:hypothetical protein